MQTLLRCSYDFKYVQAYMASKRRYSRYGYRMHYIHMEQWIGRTIWIQGVKERESQI